MCLHQLAAKADLLIAVILTTKGDSVHYEYDFISMGEGWVGGMLISPHITYVIHNCRKSLCDLSHSGNYISECVIFVEDLVK